MNWLETVLVWLFPKMLLEGSKWESAWEAQEKSSFVAIARVGLVLIGVIYVAHYYLYDLPLNLQPEERWLWLRWGVASICFGAGAVYFVERLHSFSFYRAPAIFACTTLALAQALVAVWHGKEAWVFCFLILIASAMLLRTSALRSILFAVINIAVMWPVLLRAGVDQSSILSGSLVTVGMIAVIRTSYLSEIQNFILNKENIENKEKLIELNDEFVDRLKSFIPKVIADRIQRSIDARGQSVLQASMDVLEAKEKEVACLFSDIRGFTQGSRDLQDFVSQSVIPEVKVCSDAVERHNGIPRKVGDLLFAYFDDDQPAMNLLRAVAAGMDISRLNADLNATSTKRDIRRYILISTGSAIVGNLGGFDSSIEITALGSPVNLLSRLDDATKELGLAQQLEPGDLILCSRSRKILADTLEASGVELCIRKLNLRSLDISIRDFPELDAIYTLKPDDKNYESIMQPYEFLRARLNETGGRERIRTS